MLTCNEVVCRFYDHDDDNHCGEPTELEVQVAHVGAGPFLVIETERWAIDEPCELEAILMQVRNQCYPLFDRNGDG